MSTAPAVLSWDSFVFQAAEIGGSPATAIGRDTRVVDGLGLDSIALAELLVLLMDDFGMKGLADQLIGVDWETVTMGELYDGQLGE